MSGAGRVVLVGTPIGNLGDLSPRAVEALRVAEVICCEDTRRTRVLLSAAGIPAGGRLVAMHAHNEAEVSARVVARAAEGATVAVVTDAGMPGLSDPGEVVVRRAVEAGVDLDVVPGPAAALAALVLSGLPTRRWCFEGFLPRKGRERAARLSAVAGDERTTVVYEAPGRVARTLADLAGACGGDRPVACARELTKLHQEVWRGSLSEAAAWAAEGAPRGEWVLVIGGSPAAAGDLPGPGEVAAALEDERAAGADRKAAVSAVARRLGVPRRDVYDASLSLEWPRP